MNATMSLTQYEIADTLTKNYDYISLLDAIKFIKSIFGSTCTIRDIKIAYQSIDW